MGRREMTKQEFIVENKELRARLSAAHGSRRAQHRSVLTSVQRKLQAETAEHLEDKQKLIQQNEFLEQIVESIAFPFHIIDAGDYTIRKANSAAALGVLTKDSKCYRIFQNKEQPCEAPECPCPVQEVRKTGKPRVLEHFHRDERGNVVQYAEIYAHPIFDHEGNVIQVITSVIDTTERKKIEEALRVSESRYRGLFQNIPVGISLVSLDGRVLHGNWAMSRLTGYTESELSNMKIRELFQSSKEDEQLWKRLREDGSVPEYEGKLICKDGTSFFAGVTATRIGLDGGEVVLLSAVDVTPRKKVEAELKKNARALEEQQLALTRKNIALTEVVEQIEIEKNKLKDEITTNISELVFPILEKLRLTEAPSEYLDLLEHHLREIADKFGIKISKIAPALSPREIEISGLIQSGKKVGISGRKINLFSFLQADT